MTASKNQLPPLREDLVFTRTGRSADGAPAAVLTDLTGGAYFQLGWLEQEIVARWHLGSPEAIAADLARTTTLAVGPETIATTQRFLEANGLLRRSGADIAAAYAGQQSARRKPTALVGALLFQRIPLLRPQAFLTATLPYVVPLFSRTAVAVTAGLLLLALYLVSREFSHFVASFRHFLSGEGATGVALALTGAKVIHEFGHAYAAARLGVPVPSMGVSLMLGWPLLYTDTSAVWQIPSRRQRALVAAAGVLAEAMLATLALLAWTVVDEGPLRRTLLFMATTMLVLSVVVNANPLMRFDGYFILSEALGLDNLQTRAFAALSWVGRRLGAGARAALPEPALSRAAFIALASFGAASAVYRVLLYTGIALTLHQLGFSAVALPAAAAVLAAFLIWPVLLEVSMWFFLATRRFGAVLGPLRVLAVLAVPAAVLGVPWQTTLSVPGLWLGAARQDVYAPEPGRLTALAMTLGAPVAAGDRLAEVASPDLEQARARTDLKVRISQLELARRLTGDQDRAGTGVTGDELATLMSERAGYTARLARLTLTAETAGRVAELTPGLAPGMWIDTRTRLARIVSTEPPHLAAYIAEADLHRVAVGATGLAWLDGIPDAPVSVRVTSVSPAAAATVDEPLLAGVHGGMIDAEPAANGTLVPTLALYRADLALTGPVPPLPERLLRAHVRLNAPGQSLGYRLWIKILGLWRREFG